ncbi:MAG: hypothetical protein HOO06_02490 [Bdellovibrionaceae bacterium]|jgi:hypothetical protein|nr:hypothetical protein [Pseudobdellovibrionaceae bacterium]
MKKIIIVSAMFLSTSIFAFDKAAYTKIAKETVKEALSGKVSNIDALIKKQETLVKLGIAGCKKYLKSHSDSRTPAAVTEKKALELVIANADKMKKSSLEKIEENWHDGGVFKKNGVKINEIDHMGEVNSLADTVIHAATSYLALVEYKKQPNKDHLDQVKDELSEVLEHIKHIK